jgi:hypothetical protein
MTTTVLHSSVCSILFKGSGSPPKNMKKIFSKKAFTLVVKIPILAKMLFDYIPESLFTSFAFLL